MEFLHIENDEVLINNMAQLYCKVFEKTNFTEMIERINRHIEYTGFKGIVAMNEENEVVGFTYGYRSLDGQYYKSINEKIIKLWTSRAVVRRLF
ncbi:Protein of unknown function [Bacillus wiedmannii]|nr:Protein of unknown function [Bacillus wiedmannii]